MSLEFLPIFLATQYTFTGVYRNPKYKFRWDYHPDVTKPLSLLIYRYDGSTHISEKDREDKEKIGFDSWDSILLRLAGHDWLFQEF